MKRELLSYEGVGDLRLGDSEERVLALLGRPEITATSILGERELFYEAFRVAFDREHHKVVEIACEPSSRVTYQGLDVLHDPNGFAVLIERDGNPMDCAGVVVLLALGFALSGVDDRTHSAKSITVFERGRFDRFNAIMRPW